MKRISTVLGLFALACFIGFVPWGCSDDDPTGGNGQIDATPPGVVSVTATDASHVEVVFSEAVEETSAEDPDHYLFIEGTPVPAPNADAAPSSPGDTLWVATAVLAGDGRTVTTTLWSEMNDAPYDFYITGVEDLNGNAITTVESGGFNGTQDPDITSPTIDSHTPASGATGVPIAVTVVIVFSEAMDYSSVVGAFTWTGGGGPVSFDVDASESNVFAFQPQTLLQQNTQYTVTVSGGAMDLAGNHLSQTSWNFRTTTVTDNTPPTLESITPADGSTNVDVATNLRLQFSEAIDRYGLDDIVVTPEIGDGVDSWSPDGSTITFDPDVNLDDNTQYVMVIGQGSITDLAGNPIEESIVIRFTTAASLESGQISGQLAGDPGTAAANPAGAVVVVSSAFIFDYDSEGPPPIEGADIAGTSGLYNVTNLIDGTFWPIAIMETNGDGNIEFEAGDAIGAYGLDFAGGDDTPASVTIAGGAPVGDIDFPLIDPSAISGEVSYAGTMYIDSWWIYDRYVGLFDQDPSGGGVDPIGAIGPDPLGSEQQYIIHQFDFGFPPGTYYVGAFLDVNSNGDYDPTVDPAGYYMNGASIGTVNLTNGADAFDVDISLLDPTTLAAAPAGWRVPPRDESVEARAEKWRRLGEFLERALEARR